MIWLAVIIAIAFLGCLAGIAYIIADCIGSSASTVQRHIDEEKRKQADKKAEEDKKQ